MSLDIATLPLGTTAKRRDVGLNGHHPVVLMECEECRARSWVNEQFAGERRRCRRCSTRLLGASNKGRLWTAAHKPGCRCVRCTPRDQLRENNPAWVGGFTHTTRGYRLVLLQQADPFRVMADGNGYVLEHKLVMARAVGRPLEAHEQVHHRNGRKDDNQIGNLELWIRPHPKGQRAHEYHCPGCQCPANGDN